VAIAQLTSWGVGAVVGVTSLWSTPVKLPQPPSSTISYIALDESSPPVLSWERNGTLVWAPMNALPTRTVGSADSYFFAPYRAGRAYRAFWSSGFMIDEVHGSGWRRVARLPWEPREVALASSGAGRLLVAAVGSGRHRGLWLYSLAPGRPLTRAIRLAGDQVDELSMQVTWRGRAIVAWATPSAIYARRLGGARPGGTIRLGSDRARGRGLTAAVADDGSVVVAWLRGPPGRPARVRIATMAGAATRVRTFSVGAPLQPQTSPAPAIGSNGNGLLLWAGRSDGGVQHAMAAPIAEGRPGAPVELARAAEMVAIGDTITSPDGTVEGGAWLQRSGTPRDGVYAAFARDGQLLSAERVSEEPPARPLTTSFAFDPCTGRPYLAWAAPGNAVAVASREPLSVTPTRC
jgi:hypothetical protein